MFLELFANEYELYNKITHNGIASFFLVTRKNRNTAMGNKSK
jgi:hypothetical protein